MCETLIKKITITPRAGRNRGKIIPSGWTIVDIDGRRVYRWESKGLRARVEYHFMDTGILRKQVKGKLPFIYEKKEELIEKANSIYDAQRAQLIALEDGVVKNMGGRSGWITIANNARLRKKYAKYFAV
jgi:hypothetical protein